MPPTTVRPALELSYAKHFARRHRAAAAAGVAALLLVAPLAGVWVRGEPVSDYLAFPPRTLLVNPPGFSPLAFAVVAAGALALAVPIALHLLRAARRRDRTRPAARFPSWGWAGVALLLAGWALAWTRLPWAASFQAYTFSPPWLGYILAVNALTFRRRGTCLMTRRPGAFLGLFPLSAAFWWYFEYLNRFARNWHYEGVGELAAADYIARATLAFSTVLPAVLGTYEWLTAVLRPAAAPPTPAPDPSPARGRALPAAGLTLSAAGLLLLPVFPDLLFPLVWLAPTGALAAARMLAGRPPLDPEPGEDLLPKIARLAAAALACGFVWELWNYYSLARWIYTVPYVDRFRLFEMPLLGYAGYLPFGLQCALAGDWALRPRAAAGGARP